MRRSWVANVRTHLRNVSSSGHSHAVSMCAWPMAVISCVRVALRRSSSSGPRIARAARPRRAVLGVPRVAEAVELAQELAAPRVVGARLVHQRRQDVEVARQRPRLAVEARQLAALEAERRRRAALACVGLRIELGPPEEPVAGDLDARAQLLARHRALGEHRVGADVRAAADQPLDRLAVEPQRRLGVGDEQQVDLLALPLGRHAPLHRQPPRRPQRAERHPRLPRRGSPAPRRPTAGIRSTGPAIRMRSGARASACTSAAARRATWRTRSRV